MNREKAIQFFEDLEEMGFCMCEECDKELASNLDTREAVSHTYKKKELSKQDKKRLAVASEAQTRLRTINYDMGRLEDGITGMEIGKDCSIMSRIRHTGLMLMKIHTDIEEEINILERKIR